MSSAYGRVKLKVKFVLNDFLDDPSAIFIGVRRWDVSPRKKDPKYLYVDMRPLHPFDDRFESFNT